MASRARAGSGLLWLHMTDIKFRKSLGPLVRTSLVCKALKSVAWLGIGDQLVVSQLDKTDFVSTCGLVTVPSSHGSGVLIMLRAGTRRLS